MSAFVCNDQTINRIVAGLHACSYAEYGSPLPQLSQELREVFDMPAEFGRTLYAMNVNAVEQRYPDCVGNPDELPGQIKNGKHMPYTYKEVRTPSPTQLYKSLQCFLYQCTEGDVDELPLYRQLRKFSDDLAHHMVSHTSEYEQADWG
jgi:hypothetical protein